MDADGDGANVTLALVFSDQPNTTMAVCSRVVEVAEVQTCQWRLPDDLVPFYIAEARYDIVAGIETGNLSPAAVAERIHEVVAVNVLLPQEPTGVSGGDARESGGSAVILGAFGLLLGALVARWSRSRRRGGEPPGVAAPFPRTP